MIRRDSVCLKIFRGIFSLAAIILLTKKINGQPQTIDVKLDSQMILVPKTIVTGSRFVTISKKLDSANQSNPMTLSGWTMTDKTHVPDTILIKGYRNIFDFFYDTTTNQIAFIGEKDTASKGKQILRPKIQTSAFIVQTTSASVADTVASFFYTRFDKKGYVGYATKEGAAVYKKYNGETVDLNAVGKIVALSPFNSKGLSIVRTDSGHFIYDINTRGVKSNVYKSNLVEFQPNIFAAFEKGKNEILIYDTANQWIAILFDSLKFRKGIHPYLEADNQGQHFLVFENGRTLDLRGYDAKNDTIIQYPTEDSLIWRKLVPGNKTAFEYKLIDGKTLRISEALPRAYSSDTLFLPFYSENFLLVNKRGVFITGVPRNVYLSADIGKFLNIGIDKDKNICFFYVSRSSNDTTYSYMVKKKIGTRNVPVVGYLDASICKSKIAFMYMENMLMIKDEHVKDRNGGITGWKFIDGIKILHPSIKLRPNSDIDAVGNSISIKNNTINHAYYFTEFPFIENDSGVKVIRKWMLVETKASSATQEQLIEWIYSEPVQIKKGKK